MELIKRLGRGTTTLGLALDRSQRFKTLSATFLEFGAQGVHVRRAVNKFYTFSLDQAELAARPLIIHFLICLARYLLKGSLPEKGTCSREIRLQAP